jgi:hypothetical protein
VYVGKKLSVVLVFEHMRYWEDELVICNENSPKGLCGKMECMQLSLLC